MKRITGIFLSVIVLASCILCYGCSSSQTVKFGNYQGEVIEWLVLDYEDGENLLISKKILDVKAYNDSENNEDENAIWEKCSLRAWLNNDFYSEAFSQEEQSKIVTSKVINSVNRRSGKPGGNDTEDNVFLLSLEEAEHYFANGQGKNADPTKYVKKSFDDSRRTECVWWLRTTGEYTGWAACVRYNGMIDSMGERANTQAAIDQSGTEYLYGVRPVIRVKLETPVQVSHREINITEYTGETTDDYAAVKQEHKTVEFGYYGSEKIQWLIIDEKDGYQLLLARTVLDGKPFNEERGNTTWETCSLRKWLNNEFYKVAFNADEQARIKTTTVTTGSYTTEDKVFLLSSEEALTTYNVGGDLSAYASVYAVKNGVQMNGYNLVPWWLRSPGKDGERAQYIMDSVHGVDETYAYAAENYGVRPAIWVKTESSGGSASSVDLSASEYIIDKPIEGEKDIYIKIPPHMGYTVNAPSALFISEDKSQYQSDPSINYVMADKTSFTLDFYKQKGEKGYDLGEGNKIFYKVHEPETGANGCLIYKIDQTYSWSKIENPFYLIVWKVDDRNTVLIQINDFGTPERSKYYGEELKAVLDFYRTNSDALVAFERGTKINSQK